MTATLIPRFPNWAGSGSRWKRWITCVSSASMLFSGAALAVASEAAPGPAAPAPANGLAATTSVSSASSSNSLAARVAQVEASLAQAMARAKGGESNAPVGMAVEDALARRSLLQRLVRIYEQQLSNLAEMETARNRRLRVAREAQEWSGFTEARPYSILLTDGLREAAQTERLRMLADEQALVALDGLLTENRNTLTRAEEKIRRMNEQLEAADESGRFTALSRQRELEQLRSQVAVAAVALLELERQIRQENLAAGRSSLELIQKQLIVAQADTRFTQADLDKVLVAVEADRVRLERKLAEAEQHQAAASAALEGIRQAPRATEGASGAARTARAAEVLSVRTAQWDLAVTTVRVLRLQLEASNIERTMWELRFAGYGSRRVDALRESEGRLATLSKRVALWKDYFGQKLDSTAKQVALEENRLSNLAPDSELAPLVRERLAAIRERDQRILGMLRSSERLERLLQRWNDDLQRDVNNLPFTERIQHLFSDARSFVGNVWAFELFTAEDTITVDGQKISGKRSVTIGKIIGAVLILVIGYWIIGLVSRVGSRLILRWLKVERNQGELIRRWMRATLTVCLVLFSLVSVKIPLTVFAFAGGALAIGIGFGMQTVLKNVVSGLIILFERPFRVGDVLDVGGQKGTLTSIGLRASVLQLWDGTETLFPNSMLLENSLTNWTYSNRVVRFTLAVGVAYGSDTRRVVQLLEELVARHGLIETQPKPQIFFADFSASSLMFEVRFWLDVLKTNPAQVSSDLRHMVAGAFAEHNIVIAFPQQDVHLDAEHPIRVELMAGAVQPFHTPNGPETLTPRTKA